MNGPQIQNANIRSPNASHDWGFSVLARKLCTMSATAERWHGFAFSSCSRSSSEHPEVSAKRCKRREFRVEPNRNGLDGFDHLFTVAFGSDLGSASDLVFGNRSAGVNGYFIKR